MLDNTNISILHQNLNDSLSSVELKKISTRHYSSNRQVSFYIDHILGLNYNKSRLCGVKNRWAVDIWLLCERVGNQSTTCIILKSLWFSHTPTEDHWTLAYFSNDKGYHKGILSLEMGGLVGIKWPGLKLKWPGLKFI